VFISITHLNAPEEDCRGMYIHKSILYRVSVSIMPRI
jgi:hypothetical protein